MIINVLFETFIKFITGIFSWLPDGRLVQADPFRLPWGVDNILVTGVSGYKMLAQYFPPFTVVLDAFLIYIGFKLAVRLLRMIPMVGRAFD